jgi:IS5 family transposase
MYRKKISQQLEFPNFYLPFSGQLDSDNRWVLLAQLVPWDLAEEIYHASLAPDQGAPIKSARVALGALLIKEKLGLTDRETVKAIQENPYMQFFIGFEEFTKSPPFDASLMVDFRKRLPAAGIQKIAEVIALKSMQQQSVEGTEKTSDAEEHPGDAPEKSNLIPKDSDCGEDNLNSAVSTEENDNGGKLIVDATCAPADIRFPIDISLLNEAREKTDDIIDELQRPLRGKQPRPRTYRRKARRVFLNFIKRKKPGAKLIRKTQRKLLNLLRRNFKAIDALLQNPKALPLSRFSRRLHKNLLVCRELFRQQLEMFESKTNRIDDRLVSISQPHVRPIKRGKARNKTEFGAKLSLSVVSGFSFLDRLSWDNYNESLDLIEQIESYRRRFGHYPESVHADQIYRTRKNRKYCKERGIRLSGPPLGRPPQNVSADDKKQAAMDEGVRNQVEGKFGEGKRRFGLNHVMTKLAETSCTQISLTFLVMNLEEALRRFRLRSIIHRCLTPPACHHQQAAAMMSLAC